MKIIKINFNPDRAWRWLIALFLLLTVAIFVGGYFFYRQLEAMETTSRARFASQPDTTVNLDRVGLEKVRQLLEAKAERSKEASVRAPLLIDPSS
ncbi:MAG: hypothetical protein AAB505_01535 [Patescibacteria group bacterium]